MNFSIKTMRCVLYVTLMTHKAVVGSPVGPLCSVWSTKEHFFWQRGGE